MVARTAARATTEAAKSPRALVLLAAFGGLRWGELTGLRRRRVDLLDRTVTVAEILTEVNGRFDLGPPKTEAGRRTVVLSAFLVDELASHLEQRGAPGPEGLVFPAPEGGPMRGRTSVGAPGSRPPAREASPACDSTI